MYHKMKIKKAMLDPDSWVLIPLINLLHLKTILFHLPRWRIDTLKGEYYMLNRIHTICSVNNIIFTIVNLNNKPLYFNTILFLLLWRRTDVLQMGWDMLNRTYTSSAYERRMKVAFIRRVALSSLSSAVAVAYFPLGLFSTS